ncbi:uncharacterized protein LOC116205987 [Punica granatum]|uniref:Uncharacterized protein LOC116205987 n=1 Tax=Punica granatum TaxID=22663 RepID=A0A6P8DBI2_PUNGR|nr:uncharacterized protein LOC116205987 [Punica granatum]
MRGPFHFGGGGGRGMGGGGNMLRSVGRVVTKTGVGIQEPFTASTNAAGSAGAASSAPTSPRTASGHAHKLSSKNQLSFSSCASPAPSSPFSVPASAASAAWPPFPSPQFDEYDWVSVEGSEDERRSVYYDDFLLGPAPSTDEVHSAVSALQQVFDSTTHPQFVRDRFGSNSDLDKDITASSLLHRVSSTGSDSDWIDPPLHLSNSRALQPFGHERVIDAFHMLQNDPSVQRMVVSLSTDKAVWEAVLRNEAVRELRESCSGAEIGTLSDGSSEEGSSGGNPAVDILRQMIDHTRAKFMDVVEKITKLMSELFSPPPSPLPSAAANEGVSVMDGPSDPFEGKLRASFMLSVVVLLIVVLSRARGA